MKIFAADEIKKSINFAKDIGELIRSQKTAFIDFSEGLYEVPHPMQFIFQEYNSDCHIKGGYRHGSKNFVLKVATASPVGGNGVILVFAADTGILKLILHDEGFLTTLRTAIAGMIVTELVSWDIENIGIIGSGNLSLMLYNLANIKYPNSNLMLYARNKNKLENISNNVCDTVEELVSKCDVIFTATSSTSPIIENIQRDSNKMIVALGSDDVHKSELSIDIFKESDLVIVDSKPQAAKLGDVAKALQSGIISSNSLLELGELLKSGIPEVTKTIIADFSGIGAQDVAMVEFVLAKFNL